MYLLLLAVLCAFVRGAGFVVYFASGTSAEFQAAATLAASTVQSFLKLSTDVNLLFEWGALPSGALASTAIPYVCQDPSAIYVMMPPALYVQKYGNTGNCRSYDSSVFYHATITMNSDITIGFYMGTDAAGLASYQHDFVSVAMHEIVHGLGFMSFVMDASGNIGNAPYGFLFDWIVFQNAAGSGWPSTYGSVPVINPAVSNTALLVSGGSPLLFPGNFSFELYRPTTFSYGVSVSHTAGPGLMYYRAIRGESRRTLNVYVISLLQRLGYETQGCGAPDWSNACGNCAAGYACATSGADRMVSFLFS